MNFQSHSCISKRNFIFLNSIKIFQFKGNFYLLLAFLTFSNLSFSQKNNTELKLIKTNETGIQVYESGGVEGFKKSEDNRQNSPIERKPISEWTMEECDNVLYSVNLKINALEKEGFPESEIAEYRKSKTEILQRKDLLSK